MFISLFIVQRVQNRKYSVHLARLFLICAAIFLLVGAGVLWVLNETGIIKGSFTNIFTAVFTVLGVVFAFSQLVVPSLSTNSNVMEAPIKATEKNDQDNQTYDLFLKQVKTELDNRNGKLVIRARKELLGRSIEVTKLPEVEPNNPLVVYVGLRTINGTSLYITTINSLKPGNYHIRLVPKKGYSDRSNDYNNSIIVTINRGQVSEVDWH
ncbi:MAG TPA: hypothetical protein VEP90_17550, partial [Methylomirabilota bacterium]|nr:hypothetical protein [Methylomirabilota bacterium]